MSNNNPRLKRENTTIAAMISIYCHDRHRTKDGLCRECEELLDYAQGRLNKCPFQENKPTCAKCSVHCYKPFVREKIRTVMQYAGPRMFYRHPILAIFHILNGFRKEPVGPAQKLDNS